MLTHDEVNTSVNDARLTAIRYWFEHGLAASDAAAAHTVATEVFATDFIDHDGVDTATVGRAAWLSAVVDVVLAAFAGIVVRVEHAFAAGDLVAIRYHLDGTHTGTVAGVAATGRRIHHSENEIYRIVGGQIAESWGEGSWLGTLRQLGALPS